MEHSMMSYFNYKTFKWRRFKRPIFMTRARYEPHIFIVHLTAVNDDTNGHYLYIYLD